MDCQILEFGALGRALAKASLSCAEGRAGMQPHWKVGWSEAGHGPKEVQFPRTESGGRTLSSANKLGSWDTGRQCPAKRPWWTGWSKPGIGAISPELNLEMTQGKLPFT